MIRTTDFKNKVALSASRLDTFLNCSALYAAKYLYKLPDNGNSGSSRGLTAHRIFEILANKKHKRRVNKVIKKNTCKEDTGLWRLINVLARKNKVGDEENLNLIDEFIVTGLMCDFYGDAKTKEILIEKEFDFEYEEGGICIRLKGFIDKLLLKSYKDTLVVELEDFKSSKEKFKKDKILLNHQARFYQISVIKYLFPEFKLRSFKFIFLKFRDDPIQEAVLIDENEMYGYMLWLTEINKQLNQFNEFDIPNNYAALDPAKKWLCGREGIKKDGTTMFLCGCRNPLKYWVVKKDNIIIKSSFNKDIPLDKDEVMEEATYGGCSFYYKDGKKRMKSFE